MKKSLFCALGALLLCLACLLAGCGQEALSLSLVYDDTQGAVTASAPADGTAYRRGETVTVTVSPKEGYAAAGVTCNGR